jgi:hypothetical protein
MVGLGIGVGVGVALGIAAGVTVSVGAGELGLLFPPQAASIAAANAKAIGSVTDLYQKASRRALIKLT